MSYIIFICITVPMLFMLTIIRDRFARTLVTFMIAGLFYCIFVSEINSLFLASFDYDYPYVTTTITPITEELVKAMPVCFYAFAFSDDRDKLLSIAFAVGIGFAIIENMVILLQNVATVSIFWAIIRGFGSALMHGLCTGMVGLGMHFIHQKKKLFIPGSFALIVTAMTYHSIYNTLVQSDYRYGGFLLPLSTFVILFAFQLRSIRGGKRSLAKGEEN